VKVLLTYRSRTGNTERAAEFIGGAFASRGHDVVVRPFDGLDFAEVAEADLVCVGTWVDGLILFGHKPGEVGKLRKIPMLWNKPTAAFMTYAIHPGNCIDIFANWLESELGANVIAGEAMKRTQVERLADGFVDDVLSRVTVAAE
jgi:hypothetical protein